MDKSLGPIRVRLKVPQWEDLAFIRQLWSDSGTMAPAGGPIVLTAEQWSRRMTDPANQNDCYRLIANEHE